MRDIMSDVIDPTQREKIVKIGPVDPETALLNLKKKEIMEGKTLPGRQIW